MKKLFFLLIISVFLLGCTVDEPIVKMTSEEKVMMEESVEEDSAMKEVDEVMEDNLKILFYQYEGELADVTGGRSSGIAKASFTDDAYSLLVTFRNLPDPEGTDFYEGWIVRRGLRFDVISTGVVEKEDGVYMNLYGSEKDLTDHTFYVLTQEPDDGNPAPAAHVLEGTMVRTE